MCLIVFAWRMHADFPLVVAANRDEFFDRPALPAHWWPADGGQAIFAGRDLRAGGSWMGVSPGGRFAALTNHRDPARQREGAPSRGQLVTRFLNESAGLGEHLAQLERGAAAFNGFNLLIHDGRQLAVFSSTRGLGEVLAPGVYGLSNAELDTPWPKLRRARAALAAALPTLPDTRPLLDLLRDDRPAADAELPRTGVSLTWERTLSSAFIRAAGYGTRCSSALLFHADGSIRFEEYSWDALGRREGSVLENIRPHLAGEAGETLRA